MSYLLKQIKKRKNDGICIRRLDELAQEYNKAKNTAQRKQIIFKSEGLHNLTSQEQVLVIFDYMCK
jgi:hypothetical protein